jgi:hypothetical protein
MITYTKTYTILQLNAPGLVEHFIEERTENVDLICYKRVTDLEITLPQPEEGLEYLNIHIYFKGLT